MKEMSPGRLQLVAQLGRTTTTELHHCRLKGIEGFTKEIILKRLPPERAGDLRAVQAFLEEARVAARLSHPNIVQVFEVGESADGPYAAMEYVRGVSLALVSVRAHQGRNVHHGHLAQLMARLCDAIVHAQTPQRPLPGAEQDLPWPRLVLRELNPASVLVTADGIPKLLDLGMTAATGPATPREQELFLLGVALYELTAGVNPFGPGHGRGPEAAGRAARGQYSRPSLLLRDYPRELERIVLAAIDGRLSSVRELRDRLDALAATAELRSTPSLLASWLRELFPDFVALTRASGWTLPTQPRHTPTSRPVLAATVTVEVASRPPVRHEFDLGDDFTPPGIPPRPVALPAPTRRFRPAVGPWPWLVLTAAGLAAGGAALAVMRTPSEPTPGPAVARAPLARPVLTTSRTPEPPAVVALEPLPPAESPRAEPTRTAPPRARESVALAARAEAAPARAARVASAPRQVEHARRTRGSGGGARQLAMAGPPPQSEQGGRSAPAPEPAAEPALEPFRPDNAAAAEPPPPQAAPPPPAEPAPTSQPPQASIASTSAAPLPARGQRAAPGAPVVSARPRSPVPAPTLPRVMATYDPGKTARACQVIELMTVKLAGVSPEFARGVTNQLRRSLRDQAPIYPIAMYYFIVREAGLGHDNVTAGANLAAAQSDGALLRLRDLPGIERDFR